MRSFPHLPAQKQTPKPFPYPVSGCRERPKAGKDWEVGKGRGSQTPRRRGEGPRRPRDVGARVGGAPNYNLNQTLEGSAAK